MKSPEELTDLFRATGRKVTPQRRRIFELLQGDGTHPSAEEIYRRLSAEMSTVSLKTVYQTLGELASMGVILSVDVGTRSMRFDPNVEAEHQHLLCARCEAVQDVTLPVELAPGEVIDGYLVMRTDIVVRGLCPSCRADLGEAAAKWVAPGVAGVAEQSPRAAKVL